MNKKTTEKKQLIKAEKKNINEKSDNEQIKIVACITGNNFSLEFLSAWDDFRINCIKNNITLFRSITYDPVIQFARSKCLGANTLRGVCQKPFQETAIEDNYDYILFIDSDIIFNINNLKELIKDDKDIVSGIYRTIDIKTIPAVENLDDDYFVLNGRYDYLLFDEVVKRSKLIPVDYCGMGFILIKKGVFEKIKYPWFFRETKVIEKNELKIEDMHSEDVSFCLNAADEGFKIYIDPSVVVGHRKPIII